MTLRAGRGKKMKDRKDRLCANCGERIPDGFVSEFHGDADYCPACDMSIFDGPDLVDDM